MLSNFLRDFLSIEAVRLPIFEELSNFPQIACLWTFSMCVLISVRTCRYFQNNIQGFFFTFSENIFANLSLIKLKTACFYLIEKSMISTLYQYRRPKFSKSIFKTLIIF